MTFEGKLSVWLNVDKPVFELVFDKPLPEKELNRIFWKENELILVKYKHNYNTKTWTREQMKFDKEGGFTVQDTIDAICTSERHFRRDFLDPDHSFFEGFTNVGPNELSVFWGS